MGRFARVFAAALPLTVLAGAAFCQDEQAPIPFQGGRFTITEIGDTGEKVLAFDGEELARNFVLHLDRIATVDGIEVALFLVGDGGNMCAPAEVIAWKPEGEAIRSISVGEDECGAPPAAISNHAIYFVPWLLPGASAPVRNWSPAGGMVLSGNLTYMPEPGTAWKDVADSYGHIIEAFRNEAVYEAARKLLGDGLTDMASSLLVGGGTDKTPSGILYSAGCVPHACGVSNGFMAVDAEHEKLYFAREGEPEGEAWPALDTWPAELKEARDAAFAQQ